MKKRHVIHADRMTVQDKELLYDALGGRANILPILGKLMKMGLGPFIMANVYEPDPLHAATQEQPGEPRWNPNVKGFHK